MQFFTLVFSLLKVGEGDVEIIYNHSGRSTGIAYVSFSSRSLAQKAVRDKDGKHIGTRYVELSMNWSILVEAL